MLYSNFLSPIDDYSNLPFRLLCQKYGAVATCVPLVNSTAITNNPEKLKIVDAHQEEKNIGIQFVGNQPSEMGIATKKIMDNFSFISWFNINCGCPSARTMNSGGGSALLHHPKKIIDSIKEIKKYTDLPVTVKVRIKHNFEETLSICKQLEQAEVSFIIIHGRTAGAGYSGKADWQLIKALKEQLSVPLVGNGDITSANEGEKLVQEGYCDSYMVARAAMSNPKVFCNEKLNTIDDRTNLLDEYIDLYRTYFGGEPQLKDVKLKALNFVSGAPNAASIRNLIARAKTVEEIINIKEKLETSQELIHITV